MNDLSGGFADNDVLTCDNTFYGCFQTGARAIGTIDGTPAYALATFGKVRSGLAGFQGDGFTGPMIPKEPNVAGVVNLDGGGLTVDILNLANVTNHPLVQDVTVNHNADFGTVTVLNGAAKNVTITVTATQILLSIANGTGIVTVSYPA